MVIRQALATDLDKFYECFQELMREGYAGYSERLKQRFLQTDYTVNNFYLWLERAYRIIFLAEENEQMIGFIVGDYTYGGVGFISWLGVRKNYRNRNIGKALYSEYEQFAKTRKAHLIELYTYDKVVPFYEKLGFKKIGTRTQGYFGQQNNIMNKTIGDWNDSALA